MRDVTRFFWMDKRSPVLTPNDAPKFGGMFLYRRKNIHRNSLY
jgi:hypothetical protein